MKQKIIPQAEKMYFMLMTDIQLSSDPCKGVECLYFKGASEVLVLYLGPGELTLDSCQSAAGIA